MLSRQYEEQSSAQMQIFVLQLEKNNNNKNIFGENSKLLMSFKLWFLSFSERSKKKNKTKQKVQRNNSKTKPHPHFEMYQIGRLSKFGSIVKN